MVILSIIENQVLFNRMQRQKHPEDFHSCEVLGVLRCGFNCPGSYKTKGTSLVFTGFFFSKLKTQSSKLLIKFVAEILRQAQLFLLAAEDAADGGDVAHQHLQADQRRDD